MHTPAWLHTRRLPEGPSDGYIQVGAAKHAEAHMCEALPAINTPASSNSSFGDSSVWPAKRIADTPLAGTYSDPPPRTAAPITLLVTREKAEHANLFHATSDFLNAFFM